MKYLICHHPSGEIRVKTLGFSDSSSCFTILAENLFNTPIKEEYDGRIICFKTIKQFKNVLFWQSLVKSHVFGGPFKFTKYARQAAQEVKKIFNTEVIYC